MARIGIITVHFEQYRRLTLRMEPVLYDRSRTARASLLRLPAGLAAWIRGRIFDRRHGWHRIQIPWILRHSGDEVRLYVVANDVSPATRRYLAGCARVTVLSEAFDPRGMDAVTQHGRGLDVAAERAARECDYILALDNDSFPVRSGWEDFMIEHERSSRLVSVCRREFLPEKKKGLVLPHASGMFLASALLRELNLSFMPYPPPDMQPRVVAPGVLIGLEFLKRNWTWHALHRSNRREVDPLLAAIYGDVIYHHGAGSRPTALAVRTGRSRSDVTLRRSLQVRLHKDPDAYLGYLRAEPSTARGCG